MIAAVNLVLAGVFGIIVGAFCSLFFQQRWTLKVIGLDFLLAVIVAVVAVYLVTEILIHLSAAGSIVWPVWAIASLSVVARHLWSRFRR